MIYDFIDHKMISPDGDCVDPKYHKWVQYEDYGKLVKEKMDLTFEYTEVCFELMKEREGKS